MQPTAETLLIRAQPAVDESWNTRLSEVVAGMPEAYELLRPSPEKITEEKEKFFNSDRMYNPDLRPDSVEMNHLNDTRDSLLAFRDDLESDETLRDLPVRLAYIWRINELIANLHMVEASAEGNMQDFDTANRSIYGRPNGAIFAAEVDWFREQAGDLLQSDSDAVRDAAVTALQTLVDRRGEHETLAPDTETFDRIRTEHWQPGGFYALLFAGVELPDVGPVTPEIGEQIIVHVKHNVGADDYAIVSGGSTWSVSHDRQELQRPEKYRMPLARFIGLVAHELGTHTIERINGLQQRVRLLSLGLHGYERGNEGRAVIREQVAFEAFEVFAKQPRWRDIMRRHMAISLALGVSGIGEDRRAHDGAPRSFSEVFRIMNAVDRMLERANTPDDIATADAKADKRTWDLLARVLKGTDGTGGAYYKDLVYLEGNIACWDAARKHPELIAAGDIGKFDITNPWHVELLQMYNMLPEQDQAA